MQDEHRTPNIGHRTPNIEGGWKSVGSGGPSIGVFGPDRSAGGIVAEVTRGGASGRAVVAIGNLAAAESRRGGVRGISGRFHPQTQDLPEGTPRDAAMHEARSTGPAREVSAHDSRRRLAQ